MHTETVNSYKQCLRKDPPYFRKTILRFISST